ncbi:MAG: lamin tail domain-containing protein [Candidatus Nanoarchaeia archaeon]
MRWLLLALQLTFALLLFLYPTHAVFISEVMPNPSGLEPAGEWIELYSDQQVDLQNWSVKDEKNTSYTFSLSFDGFAILACNESVFRTNFPNVTVPIFSLNCTGKGWLNNGNETLYLYDENSSLIDDVSWFGTKENYSISKCQTKWLNTSPSPGSPNFCQEDVSLEIYLAPKIMLGQKYSPLFKIKILNKKNCSEKEDVVVEYNITDENGTLVLSNVSNISIESCDYVSVGFWQPNSTGNFTLSGKINFTTSENANLSNDFATANITVLPFPLQILYYPQTVSFGSLNFLFVKIELEDLLTNYFGTNQSDLRFLVYNLDEYVLRDFSNNIIYSVKGCNSSFAIEAKNLSANSTLFLSLPFFTTPNCNNYYSSKNYSFGIRAYKLSKQACPTSCSFNCIDLGQISVYVSGVNPSLCPKTEYIYSESKTSTKDNAKSTNNAESTNTIIEIMSHPKFAHQGQTITLNFKIINSENVSKEFDVYSYIFSGLKLISEGNWTSNKMHVIIGPNSSLDLNLNNTIRRDAEPGNYSWRVRATNMNGSEKIDATTTLLILPSNLEMQSMQNVSNFSKSIKSTAEPFVVNTSKIVWSSGKGLESPILFFCSALAILCLALLFTLLSQKD